MNDKIGDWMDQLEPPIGDQVDDIGAGEWRASDPEKGDEKKEAPDSTEAEKRPNAHHWTHAKKEQKKSGAHHWTHAKKVEKPKEE